MSAGLSRYIATRLGRALLTVIGVITLVFILVRVSPGDPVDAILGDQASPEERAAKRTQLHLDQALPMQFLHFLGDVGDGSLGRSYTRPDESVSSLIGEVLPSTLLLGLLAILVAWAIAIPLGSIAAVKRGSFWDGTARGFALFGIAVPAIWLGPLLVLFFGVKLKWLPLPGDEDVGIEGLILPALTVGAALAAILMRQTRAAMMEVLSEQYVLAARARGVAGWKVVLVHALRNAMLPVMTVGAAQLAGVFSGAVIAEKVFERQGLGTLFLDAYFARDIPVVQGAVLVVAITYVLVNLVVELIYGVVDPRVRVA
jgi:peptide/nickel transport system permease protein